MANRDDGNRTDPATACLEVYPGCFHGSRAGNQNLNHASLQRRSDFVNPFFAGGQAPWVECDKYVYDPDEVLFEQILQRDGNWFFFVHHGDENGFLRHACPSEFPQILPVSTWAFWLSIQHTT